MSVGCGDTSTLLFLIPSDFTDLDLVVLRVEKGKPDDNNPLLEPEMTRDKGGVFSHGTVLRDTVDGFGKAWQISCSMNHGLNEFAVVC